MSDDELLLSRWSIEPEPTTAEFVAIHFAMQPAPGVDAPAVDSTESSWARTARREQLRTPLNDTENGWNR